MKKVVFLTMVVILLTASVAPVAAATPTLDWGSEVDPEQCGDGDLVINVNHKVTDDLDSGEAGNWWAYDSFKKHIQVWEVGTDTFCAVVQYQGTFTTVEGRSPGDTDDIAAGIKGTMQGGYRLTITGSLDSDPAYRTRGNIGAFDYGCDADIDPGDRSTCTLFDWIGEYFTSATWTWDWWGWIYHGGQNGTWVNATTGNLGDITD